MGREPPRFPLRNCLTEYAWLHKQHFKIAAPDRSEFAGTNFDEVAASVQRPALRPFFAKDASGAGEG